MTVSLAVHTRCQSADVCCCGPNLQAPLCQHPRSLAAGLAEVSLVGVAQGCSGAAGGFAADILHRPPRSATPLVAAEVWPLRSMSLKGRQEWNRYRMGGCRDAGGLPRSRPARMLSKGPPNGSSGSGAYPSAVPV